MWCWQVCRLRFNREFYAPWCGHCKTLIPVYKKVAQKLNGLVKVVAIDCDAHKDLCGQFGVQGFPTIKLFQSDKSKPPLDYQGQRDASSMVDYCIGKLPSSFLTVIDEKKKTLDAFLEGSTLAKAILFSKKASTPALLKALSIEYDQRLAIGEVKPSLTLIHEKYGIKSFPSVMVFPSTGGDPILYEGVLKNAPLSTFFDLYAVEKKAGGNTRKEDSSSKKSSKVVKVKEFDPSIPNIADAKDFKRFCVNAEKACVITILAPNEEEPLLESLAVLTETKRTFQNNFAFSYIDALSEHTFAPILHREYGLSDMYPSIFVINLQRKWYSLFRGGFDIAGVDSFLKDLVKGKGVRTKLETPTLLLDAINVVQPITGSVKDEL